MRFPKLSDWPIAKIKVECRICGLKAQYDRDGLIKAGGDRRLVDVMQGIKERKQCPKLKNAFTPLYEVCQLKCTDQAAALEAQNWDNTA